MTTVISKLNDPSERFHAQTVVRQSDSSFIVTARHVRTDSRFDAAINSSQLAHMLFFCYKVDAALPYFVMLKDHNFIELRSMESTPLCVSPSELISSGFNQNDVHRIIEQMDEANKRIIAERRARGNPPKTAGFDVTE